MPPLVPCRPRRPLGPALALIGAAIVATSALAAPPGLATVPRIPGEVVEPPAWLVKGAPFDVARLFAMPRSEENAAPLYLDAFLEFGPEMAACFPTDVRARADAALARAGRLKPVWDSWSQAPASVDRARLDAVIADHAEGLRKLDLAQKRPRCVFAIGVTFDSPLPHAQVARNVVRVLAFRADRDIDRGDFDHAIGCVEKSLRLARDLRPRGPIIDQIVSIAIDGSCTNAIIPLFLADPRLKPAHCDRLIALLSRHESESVDPFATAVMSEYIVGRELARVFEDKVHVRPDRDGRGADRPLDRLGVGRVYLEMMNSAGNLTGEPENREAQAGAARTVGQLGLGTPKDREALAEIARRLLAVASKVEPDRRRTFEGLQAKYLGRESPDAAPLARIIAPDYRVLATACARDAFYLRSAKCLLALRRWRMTHREPPPSLEAACKDATMPGVPIDPFSDSPLKLATIDGSPVVYSIGADGRDDRALKDSDLGRKPLGDMLARMPNPRPRGR